MNRRWVIFDLDGTLIESEQIWRDVRREFVIENGGPWRDDAQQTMMGMRTEEWAKYVHDELGVALPPDEIARRVIDGVTARISEHVPVLPGANDALERLAAAFPMGLATSAALAVAQAVLAKTGWTKYFPVVVSADQVSRGKPAPDVYLRACELMHADSQHTAAIEDSTNGIRSAHAAQLAVVAIPNRAFPPDDGALSLASCVLQNIEDLNAATVDDVLRA